jgi:lipid-A-disaccharide synthase
MKYFLIAGEASGDLHASNLMKGVLTYDPDARFRFMGGDRMREVRDGLVLHYRETSYMMLDVVFHLRKIFRNLRKLKREIREWQPDVVIPVDYPGFNLRMAKYSTSLGIKVFYYISPKVWAWKQRRVTTLKRYTDYLFTILPFEQDFFQQFNMEVEYFGNPLVDAVDEFKQGFEGHEAWKQKHGLDEKPVVALLAGSRKREIEAMLPVMVEVAGQFPDYQFMVAGAPSIAPSMYEQYLNGTGVEVVYQETYALLETAVAGLITSGTATLEAALFNVPQVVLYRTGSLAYHLAKRVIKVNFISLVNLILGKELVLEIIQKELFNRAHAELSRILEDSDYRGNISNGYSTLQSSLGKPGVSRRIGKRMVKLLKENGG